MAEAGRERKREICGFVSRRSQTKQPQSHSFPCCTGGLGRGPVTEEWQGLCLLLLLVLLPAGVPCLGLANKSFFFLPANINLTAMVQLPLLLFFFSSPPKINYTGNLPARRLDIHMAARI